MTLEERAERCAFLLRHPIATKSGVYCSLAQHDGRCIVESYETRPDIPIGFIASYGVGSQCRWMLIKGLLVILFKNGRYVYKEPPKNYTYTSDDPYGSAFSFSNENSDAIVLAQKDFVYVIHVRGSEIKEETLELHALCYAGYFDLERNNVYHLVGQTPRSLPKRGRPLTIEVSEGRFVASYLHGSGLENVESIVSVVNIKGRTFLLCAEGSDYPVEDDQELGEYPDITEHFRFYIVDEKDKSILAKIELMRFMSIAGPDSNPRFFFEGVLLKGGESGIFFCSLSELLAEQVFELKPLIISGFDRPYAMGMVRYDEHIGFTSLAVELPFPGPLWFVWSKDGEHWERKAVGR